MLIINCFAPQSHNVLRYIISIFDIFSFSEDGREAELAMFYDEALPTPQTTQSTSLDELKSHQLDYLKGDAPTYGQIFSTPKDKKWTGPDSRSRARVLYNYLRNRAGNDIFGKRMGSMISGRTSSLRGGDQLGYASGYHGSEFLGKRAYYPLGVERIPVSEFLGKRSQAPFVSSDQSKVSSDLTEQKRARISEFLGKRGRASEFLGKRGRVSEFLGKRNPDFEGPEKRMRASEFLGKRARVSEFLGKRSDSSLDPEKRTRISEFLGKRARISEFLGKRARISEFLGKRHNLFQNAMRPSSMRRVSEFLGKRSGASTWEGENKNPTSQELTQPDSQESAYDQENDDLTEFQYSDTVE